MYQNTTHDECLICYKSLLTGVDLFKILIQDSLCYSCRMNLEFRYRKELFEGHTLFTFYDYTQDVSSLLIRYKDYHDRYLGTVFLKPIYPFLNIFFKDYVIILVPSSDQMIARRGFNHLEGMLADVKLKQYDILSKGNEVQRFNKQRIISFKNLDESLHFDKVIIFDDVTTSGNSLKAAIDALDNRANKIVLISVISNMK